MTPFVASVPLGQIEFPEYRASGESLGIAIWGIGATAGFAVRKRMERSCSRRGEDFWWVDGVRRDVMHGHDQGELKRDCYKGLNKYLCLYYFGVFCYRYNIMGPKTLF